jgi:hypothetical protein
LRCPDSGGRSATPSRFTRTPARGWTFSSELEPVTDTIAVRRPAPLLQTDTSSLSHTIGASPIDQLPLNGRNFSQLATLAAGVLPAFGYVQRESGLNSHGQWAVQNNFLLDGVDNNSQVMGIQDRKAQVLVPNRMFVRGSWMDFNGERLGSFPAPGIGGGNNDFARDDNTAFNLAHPARRTCSRAHAGSRIGSWTPTSNAAQSPPACAVSRRSRANCDGSKSGSRTSNPPVNRSNMVVLPSLATPCAEAPDCELDPIKSGSVDDRDDAALCRLKPRLGVSKGQVKGKVKH